MHLQINGSCGTLRDTLGTYFGAGAKAVPIELLKRAVQDDIIVAGGDQTDPERGSGALLPEKLLFGYFPRDESTGY